MYICINKFISVWLDCNKIESKRRTACMRRPKFNIIDYRHVSQKLKWTWFINNTHGRGRGSHSPEAGDEKHKTKGRIDQTGQKKRVESEGPNRDKFSGNGANVQRGSPDDSKREKEGKRKPKRLKSIAVDRKRNRICKTVLYIINSACEQKTRRFG